MQHEVSDCEALHGALDLLGRAWAGPVLWAMLEGRARFSEIRAAVPGVSDAVLATRLRDLCERGLVERLVAAGPPTAVTYRLTTAGVETRPALVALRDYALRHRAAVVGSRT